MSVPDPTLKYCKLGRHLVSPSRFWRAPQNRDGLMGSCAQCLTARDRSVGRAVQISIRRQRARAGNRIYHSRWNPNALTPDLRTSPTEAQ